MTNIQIDSKNKRVEIDLELKGETTPLHIVVENYLIRSESGETTIEVSDVHTSREWLNCLIEDYLTPDKRRFKVPPAVKVLL